jgi:hypothetical protein
LIRTSGNKLVQILPGGFSGRFGLGNSSVNILTDPEKCNRIFTNLGVFNRFKEENLGLCGKLEEDA